MPHIYTYTILRHQRSLDSSSVENFAVLVEGQAPNGWVVLGVGRTPEHSSADIGPVGAAIAQRFPQILDGIVKEALQSKNVAEGVLDSACRIMLWNFNATAPATIQDEESIDRVGFKLFAQFVAHAGELLTRVTPNGGPVHQTHFGEMFQTAVPIPEPTEDLFATA